MAEPKRSRALVLKTSKLGEADLRIEALSEGGELLALRVHGIRKSRRRGQLLWTPGNTLEVVYYQKASGLLSVKEAVLSKDRIPAKPSWDYLQSLHSLLRLFARFGKAILNEKQLFLLADGGLDVLFEIEQEYEKQKQEDLLQRKQKRAFRQTAASLPEEAQSKAQHPRQRLLFVFLKVRLFRLAGLLGDPKHCASCNQALEGRAFFQFPELSFLCTSCADKQGAEATAEDFLKARLFGLLARNRFGTFQARGLFGLGNFFANFFGNFVEKDSLPRDSGEGDFPAKQALETLPLIEQIQRPPLDKPFEELEGQLQRIIEEGF